MRLCVIPARGGSKRIPRKNIRDFLGKPIIAWSIEAAHKSKCFEHIIVSTDDQEIAERAEEFGAEIPFIRPLELADDYSTTSAVVAHAVEWHQNHGVNLEAICCLYATAPMVYPADIRKGLEMLRNADPNQFVFTATTYPSPIQRALRIDHLNGSARMWQPECFSQRSQDLETAYHDAAQFYWGRPESWRTRNNIFEGSLPLVLPRWRVEDIDNEDDWSRAEEVFSSLRGKGFPQRLG